MAEESKENEKKPEITEKTLSDFLVGNSALRGASPVLDTFSSLKAGTDFPVIDNFYTLSSHIDDICRPTQLSPLHPFPAPLSSNSLWGEIRKTDGSLAKWAVDTGAGALFKPEVSYATPALSVLGTLEQQTGLLAKNSGITHITSVASQVNAISELLASQPMSVKELIAPSSMIDDLQSLALSMHKSFMETGIVSDWGLGTIDSASYLVDRQVDWTTQLCKSAYGTYPIPQIDDFDFASPKVNVISWLPITLETEKKNRPEIKPEEALEKSAVFRLSEKGKRLIDKVISINKLCERTSRKPIFKYTGGTMKAAATMGGTFCATKEAFGELIDGFYIIFYENLERIKEYVPDAAVRSEEVFKCVFRVKDMRTDYRHDYEHGTEKEICKKEQRIGESYAHYSGRTVLLTEDDYQKAQNMLYDDFDVLADYLLDVVGKTVS